MVNKARHNQGSPFHKRIVLLTIFLFIGIGLIVLRVGWLQVVRGAEYKKQAEAAHTTSLKLTPERGQIKVVDKFSSEAIPAATNIEKPLVYAVPESIVDPVVTSEKLAAILGLDAEEILKKISDTNKKYVPLKKQLTDSQWQQIKDLRLSGIAFDREIFRFYPLKDFLSAVLGFVGYKGDEKVGLYGLERQYEEDLKGEMGKLVQKKDASGVWVFGTRRDNTPAVDGDNFILTIDRGIQEKVESVLKDTVQKNGADSGCIIVMDPKTGAIQAMATYPSFDPNEYQKAKDPNVYNNNCTTGTYEPGSVFKPVTFAAAIDNGKITPDTTYNDTGKVVVDGYTIENSDHKAHGIQTMTQALGESLNTGAIFAKDKVGNKEFLEYVKKFGFGQKTGIELPETAGNLDNLRGTQAKVNFDTASFGQGLSVTPLQLVQSYGALANGGQMVKPYIVQSRVTPSGKVTNTSPQTVRQVVSQKTASIISAMLVDVVENGHGKRAQVSGYYVGGKTGTAQVPKKDGRGYEANNNIGSFIGYAPIDDPKFVMLVRINHPRTVSFAESTAAPAFGQLAHFLLNHYNVPPTRTEQKK